MFDKIEKAKTVSVVEVQATKAITVVGLHYRYQHP